MKNERNMFLINLQMFAEGGEGEETTAENTEEATTETPPTIDVEAIKKEMETATQLAIENALKTKDEEIAIKLAEKDKAIAEMQANSKKEKEEFEQMVESLKDVNKKDDIIKTIEENRLKSEKARKDAELLEMANKAKEDAERAIAELNKVKQESAEKEKFRALELEKQKFITALTEDKTNKPWLADKIDKVLKETDYEAQKTDYRALMKFFDTPDEEARYKAMKNAGGSAFSGVRMSANQDSSRDGIFAGGAKYINRLLGK